MLAIAMPESPQLKGEEAITALQTFVSGLERDKEVTRKTRVQHLKNVGRKDIG